MAFPGTYNFNYYRGDTAQFVVRPKTSNGASFDLTDYDSDFEEHFNNEDGEPISKTLLGDEDDDMIMSDTEICNESDDEDNKIINEKQETFSFFKKK
jgi:hypothetical protein